VRILILYCRIEQSFVQAFVRGRSMFLSPSDNHCGFAVRVLLPNLHYTPR